MGGPTDGRELLTDALTHPTYPMKTPQKSAGCWCGQYIGICESSPLTFIFFRGVDIPAASSSFCIQFVYPLVN